MIKLRSFLCTGLLVLAGCATYHPVDIATLQPNERIRLELEQAELGRLIAFADPVTRSVSGRFVNEVGDSVSVILGTTTQYQQVMVPRSSIIATQLRVVDNRKSFIVSGLIVGGVAALAAAGFTGGGGPGGGDGGGIDETRIPLLGWRIPFSISFGR